MYSQAPAQTMQMPQMGFQSQFQQPQMTSQMYQQPSPYLRY
jgi:hypothetical protein